MPAKSIKQREMMAIAEHHPDQLYARNRGVLKMGKEKMHDFASTPEKGLPMRKAADSLMMIAKKRHGGGK